MDQWMPLIWTVVWIVVGLIVLGFIAWVVVATIAAKNFKRFNDSIDRDFDDFHSRIGRRP